jgi:hypothetical protein
MKFLAFAIPLLLCSLRSPENRFVPEPTPELDSFISEFKEAVLAKNKVRLMALMDPAYKMEQHDKFHKGNTDRFLNELFCGSIVGGSGFKCVQIKKVRGIELASKGEGDKTVVLVFQVSEKKIRVDVILTAVMRMEDGVKVYGMRGAVG